MASITQIPLFDLAQNPTVEDIAAACRSAGCFNIISDKIDQALTDSLIAQMAAFFDLPDDHPTKRAAHRENNAGASGWTPTLEEPAYEAGTIAWVESFDCVLSRRQIAALPSEISRELRPSIWPQLPGFRDVVRTHWDALFSTAEKIFPLISGLLKQEPEFLAARASTQAESTLRLLNYPPNPLPEDTVSKGISAHTDFECITLIHQTAPGLEVRTPGGEWLQAPVAPGQWTVLIGDMVERWSNGEYPATPHRVPTTKWPRRSIVMFFAADPGLEVRPLDAFVSESNPPRFEAVTQDSLIDTAMARAEANRQEMLAEVEKLRAKISPG